MKDLSNLYADLIEDGQQEFVAVIRNIVQERYAVGFHGHNKKWINLIEQLPEIKFDSNNIKFDQAVIQIGLPTDIDESLRTDLKNILEGFMPWRKGPYNLFGVDIDTEWRSDLKWDRLKEHITSLANRKVLDVGCGSGYHCWRMLGAGAQRVIGIDPTMLFVMQYEAIQNYINHPQLDVLPLGSADMPDNLHYFDSVFSMGILYHRRDPQEHLAELKDNLRDGGELILETLVIDEKYGESLVPDGRYARMRNVWCIPSTGLLEKWLQDAGYKDIRCVDVSVTTLDEQRNTDWLQSQSLVDFLDAEDQSKTIEGYPAPTRAIFIATA